MNDLIGKLLANRYRVDAFIGRGGMAKASKVWDLQRMAFFAMKVLHEKLAIDRVFLDAFRQESNTLANLQHPNIVRFYGFEEDGQRVFLLMDFIEGKTLESRIIDENRFFSIEENGVISCSTTTF